MSMRLWDHPDVVRAPDPILRRPCAPAPSGSRETRALCKRLLGIVAGDPGAAGLAAPQIGVSLAVVALRVNQGQLVSLVNPIVLEQSEEEWRAGEACFSLPGVTVKVMRPVWVTVSAENAKGVRRVGRYTMRDARTVLHEVDHLNGRLITDYAVDEERAELGTPQVLLPR